MFRAWHKITPGEMDTAARRLAEVALGANQWQALQKVWIDVPEARDPWIRAARACASELVVKLFRAERERRRDVDHRIWSAWSHFHHRNEDLEYDAVALMAALRSARRSVLWAQKKGEISDAAAERITTKIDKALKKHSVKPQEERAARLEALSLMDEAKDGGEPER